MKILNLISFATFGILVASCCKFESKMPDCNKSSEKIIYEALVYSESCAADRSTIVSGKIKYLKDGKTFKLVDFGLGNCDDNLTLNACPNGKCDGGAIETKVIDSKIDFSSKEISELEREFIGL